MPYEQSALKGLTDFFQKSIKMLKDAQNCFLEVESVPGLLYKPFGTSLDTFQAPEHLVEGTVKSPKIRILELQFDSSMVNSRSEMKLAQNN